MSDGNTAAHISPVPSESEMAHIRGIFERAANAIVGYSQLGAKVAELTSQVEALRREVERVREHEKYLEEQNVALHRERGEARAEVIELKGSLAIAKDDLSRANTKIENLTQEVNTKSDTIFRLNRESDDNLLRAMHAEEELQAVKAKLEEAEAWFDGVKAMLHPQAPEPVVVAEVTPEPPVEQAAMGTQSNPPYSPPHWEPIPQAEPTEEPRKTGFSWQS